MEGKEQAPTITEATSRVDGQHRRNESRLYQGVEADNNAGVDETGTDRLTHCGGA